MALSSYIAQLILKVATTSQKTTLCSTYTTRVSNYIKHLPSFLCWCIA